MAEVEARASTGSEARGARSARSADLARGLRLLRRWGTIGVIVLTGTGFSIASPWFFAFSNFNNIIFSMIVSCLVSVGLTFVVAVGSFDLSVGLVVTTTSIVVALMIPIVGPWGAILVGLGVACVIGLINGLLVTFGRLSGIVVTLGMMFSLEGVNTILTAGYQVPVDYGESAFLFLGQGKIGPIGFPVILLAGIWLMAQFLFTKTRIGYYIAAVGDNPVAAFYSGIKVYQWVIVSFVIAALFAGAGGVIETSISSSAQPVGGEGYLLEAFAAIYLGSTVLGRGKPHVFGTLLGVFFIYMVSIGMSMVGFPYAARQLFAGIILIVAVGANALLIREEVHLKFV